MDSDNDHDDIITKTVISSEWKPWLNYTDVQINFI